MTEKVQPYRITVEKAEDWFERPIKVSLELPTPNGSTAQSFTLTAEDALTLSEALDEYVFETYWFKEEK